MPTVPVCLLEPVWAQFAALLPARPAVVPAHPLGCHRRRVPDRMVFEHVVAALVHGSGYERVATAGCSDRTIRRRVREWAEAGLTEVLHALALQQYDRMIGIELADVAADCCVTKAPCGGEAAGRSPVDRGKQGLKRSTLTDASGLPLHLVAAGANRHDSPLLGPTLDGLRKLGPLPADVTAHLDRAYDNAPTRVLLDGLGFTGEVARKGVPAPLQAGKRWVVERTQAWMNAYGKLRRCTEKSCRVVDFYLFLAAAFVVTRCLIQRARPRYRWPGRPTTRRLK
ncbi:MAG: IS5 family transposase [Actinomycetota bacterium]|nr:IS5 family transposase [Actinomycetota bacterium]